MIYSLYQEISQWVCRRWTPCLTSGWPGVGCNRSKASPNAHPVCWANGRGARKNSDRVTLRTRNNRRKKLHDVYRNGYRRE